MKRLATLAGLAFAALVGSFAMSAPAHATSTVTCTTPTTSGSNTYPENYLWICSSASSGTGHVPDADASAANTALGHLGGAGVGLASNAKTQMASNKHYIYVFADDDDYNGANAYCTGTGDGNNTANPPIPGCHALLPSEVALTTINSTSGIDQTVIIASRVDATTVHNTNVANTTVHEAGHQLDVIYGASLYGSGNVASDQVHEFGTKLTGLTTVFAGTITAGDTLELTFNGAQLSSPVTIIHNVVGTDTLTTIASDFKTKINSNTALTAAAIGVQATSSAGTLTVTSKAILTYTKDDIGSGHTVMTLSSYDWPTFDAAIACKNGSGVFQSHKDENGVYICSSLAQGTVGGTIHPTDIMGITVTDNAVSPNPRSVSYVVKTGDTDTTIAAGLALAINNDTGTGSLHNAGITATSAGAVLSISSGTNASTYAYSPGMGVTETLTGLSTTPVSGAGNTFSNTYNADTFNDVALQQAWPYYFTNAGAALWSELFAEETAIVAGQTAPLGQTQDDYLGSGNFSCSKNFVNAVENTGSPPSTTSFPYSSQCK